MNPVNFIQGAVIDLVKLTKDVDAYLATQKNEAGEKIPTQVVLLNELKKKIAELKALIAKKPANKAENDALKSAVDAAKRDVMALARRVLEELNKTVKPMEKVNAVKGAAEAKGKQLVGNIGEMLIKYATGNTRAA
jgi:flagellar hook-associated protein FlgK